jgi:hypothetical protein
MFLGGKVIGVELASGERSLEGIKHALELSQEKMLMEAVEIVARLRDHPLQLTAVEDRAAGLFIRTIGVQQSRLVPRLAGQVVTDAESKVPYFSACAT